MHLRWTHPALAHIAEISAHIRKDNPAAARRVVEQIRRDAEHLYQHPLFGRAGRIEGTRELVVSKFPYIIAYRLAADTAEILAVIHDAREWPKRFSGD
ncbi:MAG: type II toxin-antitoxin system RelE/ParE family toxin [Rhodocyclaceae bacterium]|nr:type II toxin-antitoxin system RelE/ParE family toxin [Rhodocyclaceae bacterium]